MSDPEPLDTVYVEVPKRTKELAKDRLEHGGLTRVVREALARVAHGEQTTEKNRVKDHLNELRDKRRELKAERDDINRKLEQLEVKVERAETRLDALRDREGEYEGALKMLEQSLQEGKYVFLDHGGVINAAECGDCTPEDVLDDLKERNPDIPDEQFEPKVPV